MTLAVSGNSSRGSRSRHLAVVAIGILLAYGAGTALARDADGLSVASSISIYLAQAASTVRFRQVDPGARDALRSIYSSSDDRPLWSVNGQATPQALQLVDILRDAQAYGLDPREYGADVLAALALRAAEEPRERARSMQLWARFDVGLSIEALRLICDLHYGRISARAVGFGLRQPRRKLDLEVLVLGLAHSDNLRRSLASIEPNFYLYRLLEQALAKYRRLASRDSALTVLPPLPHRSVKPGEAYRGAPALRRRLRAVGDLPPSAEGGGDTADSTELGPRLVSALERFQQRHGLAVDGILGPATFRQLTTPFAVRVRQIELNLERWRWLPALHAPLIIVNIPQFRLFAFRTTAEQATDTLQMRVIVGHATAAKRTPTFVAEITYVVFRPYWNVPRRITLREMLPRIRAHPGFLAAQHLQIVGAAGHTVGPVAPTPANLAALVDGRLRLRQLPGPANALGLIKFVLPNRYEVFLHSTPARRLFLACRRDFSHGCIRVSNPVALAEFVLRGTPGDWSAQHIEAAMNGTDDRRVVLAKPVRVMIVYQTALATAGGQVLFFDDLYGRDQRLERLLGLTRVSDPAALDKGSSRSIRRSERF